MERLVEWCIWGADWCAKSEVWAAWWQGIGTVAALFVAIGVAAFQRRAERENRRKDEVTRSANAVRMTMLFGLRLKECLDEYVSTHERIKGPADFHHDLYSELRRLRAVLQNLAYWPGAIPMDSLPFAALIAVLSMRSIAEEARAEAADGPMDWENFWRPHETFKGLRARADKELQVVLAAGRP
jgi:hypothetical protein